MPIVKLSLNELKNVCGGVMCLALFGLDKDAPLAIYKHVDGLRAFNRNDRRQIEWIIRARYTCYGFIEVDETKVPQYTYDELCALYPEYPPSEFYRSYYIRKARLLASLDENNK